MAEADGFRHFFYRADDGLELHARIYESERGDALPVVCLPGLTRNARDFHELALHLSRRRKIVAFDFRGRGLSAYDPDWRRYDVPVEAADVVAGLTAMDIGRAAFIGTSRGGLVIMALAAMRPGVLGAVILNDIGPVLDGAGLALIRSYLERAPKPRTIDEAIQIQRAASGEAFTALTDSDWERTTGALYRHRDGKPVADFDPRLVRTVTSIDLNEPLPQVWAQFMGLAGTPLMVVRGANSRLLSEATLNAMARRHPAMISVTVEGQGHAPLLETAELPQAIEAFLDRNDRA